MEKVDQVKTYSLCNADIYIYECEWFLLLYNAQLQTFWRLWHFQCMLGYFSSSIIQRILMWTSGPLMIIDIYTHGGPWFIVLSKGLWWSLLKIWPQRNPGADIRSVACNSHPSMWWPRLIMLGFQVWVVLLCASHSLISVYIPCLQSLIWPSDNRCPSLLGGHCMYFGNWWSIVSLARADLFTELCGW